MVHRYFDKNSAAMLANKSAGASTHTVTGINFEEQQLPEQYISQLLENLKNVSLYSSFRENIWGAYLADMHLISKYNKEIRFLLCIIDVFNNKHGFFL